MSQTRSHLLKVAKVITETGDACSIVFERGPQDELDYRPGQFLTLRVPSDRCGSIARCYSLSSSPHTDAQLQVTVKRTQDGYASHWICDNVTAGDEIEILPPAGVFSPASLDSDLVLLAGGSGITPIMSIMKSVLEHGTGKVQLIYANRDERSVIFDTELRELATAHPDRLVILHWLETVQGLPSEPHLRALLAPHAEREMFVCGPRPFMNAAVAAGKSLDIPRRRIHTEKFVSLGGNPFQDALPAERSSGTATERDRGTDVPSEPATLDVELDGERHTFAWPRERKLLDYLLEQGLEAPFSCREGQCSACACRISSGEVKMLHNEILDAEDIADGIRLACQSVPITDEVAITYE